MKKRNKIVLLADDDDDDRIMFAEALSIIDPEIHPLYFRKWL